MVLLPLLLYIIFSLMLAYSDVFVLYIVLLPLLLYIIFSLMLACSDVLVLYMVLLPLLLYIIFSLMLAYSDVFVLYMVLLIKLHFCFSYEYLPEVSRVVRIVASPQTCATASSSILVETYCLLPFFVSWILQGLPFSPSQLPWESACGTAMQEYLHHGRNIYMSTKSDCTAMMSYTTYMVYLILMGLCLIFVHNVP
jgi:hypothetical protein